jgi:hypothetical protein
MLSAEPCILLVLIAERASQVASFAAGGRAWNVGVHHGGCEQGDCCFHRYDGRRAWWRTTTAAAQAHPDPSGSTAPPVLCFTHWSP